MYAILHATSWQCDLTVRKSFCNKQGATRQRRPSEPAVHETKRTRALVGLNREIKPLTSTNFWATIMQL